MPNYKKLLFWGLLCRIPLSERVTDLIFPVLLTIVSTLFIDFCARKIFGSYSTLVTLLLSVLVFFIVLWLQNLILIAVFRKGLHDFLYRTKKCHPVTKTFGAEILRRFLSNGFKNEMIEDVESLASMLQKIEYKDGHPLALACYAILLNKAAEMIPTCLWATWDFESVPIQEVFSSTGEVKSEYDFYFRTLASIYGNIKKPENKKRIFIFKDTTQENQVKNHKGWKNLLQMHQKWNLEGKEGNLLYCYTSDLKGAQVGYTSIEDLDDFVYFKISGVFSYLFQSCIIGYDKERRAASLRHGDVVVEDSDRMFNQLFGKCKKVDG